MSVPCKTTRHGSGPCAYAKYPFERAMSPCLVRALAPQIFLEIGPMQGLVRGWWAEAARTRARVSRQPDARCCCSCLIHCSTLLVYQQQNTAVNSLCRHATPQCHAYQVPCIICSNDHSSKCRLMVMFQSQRQLSPSRLPTSATAALRWRCRHLWPGEGPRMSGHQGRRCFCPPSPAPMQCWHALHWLSAGHGEACELPGFILLPRAHFTS